MVALEKGALRGSGNPMNRYAIIADDFTGAGDSGVHFAVAGLKTALLLRHSALSNAFTRYDAVALSTESRFLPAKDAAGMAAACAVACRRAGADTIYKKIDSTLRGNIGIEIEAVLIALECETAVICPAMPKTGRGIRNGILYLHGVPIHETEMGRDPFNPVADAHIASIIGIQTHLPIAQVGLEDIRAGSGTLAARLERLAATGKRILVADAETDDDLLVLTHALREVNCHSGGAQRFLPVGAGGLAEALAGPPTPYLGDKPSGRLLAVIGSLTDTTMRQIDCAVESGIYHILDLDMSRGMTDFSKEAERLRKEIHNVDGRSLLLKNLSLPEHSGKKIATVDALKAAEVFAAMARMVCEQAGIRQLYVTGGSTATAVTRELGLDIVSLERECMPGVVLGTCESGGLPLKWFIAKAGGFGRPDTLVRLAQQLCL